MELVVGGKIYSMTQICGSCCFFTDIIKEIVDDKIIFEKNDCDVKFIIKPQLNDLDSNLMFSLDYNFLIDWFIADGISFIDWKQKYKNKNTDLIFNFMDEVSNWKLSINRLRNLKVDLDKQDKR